MANCWQPQASFVDPAWASNNQPCMSSSTFRDMVHAFPRSKQTGRVTKPRSAGNSPASAGRRRTTTMPHSSTMYPSYQAPFNPAALASAFSRSSRSRPMSWHPVMESSAYATAPYFADSTTLDTLAAVGMCPQPLHTAPAVLESNDMLSSYAEGLPFFSEVQDQLPLQQSTFVSDAPVSWETSSSAMPAMTETMSDCWSFDMASMHNSMPSAYVADSTYDESVPSSGCLTGPATPQFLPIQRPDDQLDLQTDALSNKLDSEDELVGMGLYSKPDALTESSLMGLCGKGLKLEETFTPSANDAEDKDDDDDDDEEVDDDASQEHDEAPVHNDCAAPAFTQPTKPATNMMHKSFFVEEDDFEQHAMVGSQPLINMASQPCVNYGYGWI
ncbi:uncharacterized protein BP01DRAFT_358262 [Aspergillus saccharolyticus JOP 1030-1]|uniref:Uncharacterized protein n=1 Tax=Aspergillus saccharolyticus JOP 1030-1 TaxID=1450539 RepID=A0A318Z9D0_9EURO|nr:hypothetical protein BP01DRAFT_358262 [Aspergillus saccharolyticus JOP 1030-1]PYH43829.1 hypothetical protein BP01DRAFT_358262 [Aspergillus saccharolyticus JOP 1030-1]